MDKEEPQKAPIMVSKSFMAVGPTLHYSHENVQRCWLLAVVAFGLTCLFWSKIVTGTFWSFDLNALGDGVNWRLDQFAIGGVSIFEYPWQVLVLGLLMGILGMAPLLVSQLLSFRYSILFILSVFFLANLPGFAVCLLLSCFAVACRPLRFRSRIIAIALCTAPQLVYWGFWGGTRGVEPVVWGFSFAPWVCAWLVGLIVAGLVLGIGHYTRYRPGLIWLFTSIVLVIVIVLFEFKIGFDELDYQLYVAKNNPEQVSEFHDHSITEALDKSIVDPAVRRYLSGFFYPTEPIPLREELKREIQVQLSYDRWPSWFIVPDELNYQEKRQWLDEQYDLFINPPKSWWMPIWLHKQLVKRRSVSRRMPIALYYKALLSEYSPDIKLLGEKEVLHFYSDYPHERSREIWYRLYRDHGYSAESFEAQWRISKHWAGQGRFELADELLVETHKEVLEQLDVVSEQSTSSETFFSPFRPPVESVMTAVKLTELRGRIEQLLSLIGSQNRTGEQESGQRLARFVMLNPHSMDYGWHLDSILSQIDKDDPLRDNILLAKANLVADEQLRAEQLNKLHKEFQYTDGGMQALYELTRLKIRWYQSESNLEQKKEYLAEARAVLVSFLSLYPESYCAEQVKKNLDALPTVE